MYKCTLMLFSISKFQQTFKASFPGALSWNEPVFCSLITPFSLPPKEICCNVVDRTLLYCNVFKSTLLWVCYTSTLLWDAEALIRDHPLGILHPEKIALSLWITVCFDVHSLQDRIFFSNLQLSDGAFAVPLAQFSVKGFSQDRVSKKKEKKKISSRMLTPPLGSLPI